MEGCHYQSRHRFDLLPLKIGFQIFALQSPFLLQSIRRRKNQQFDSSICNQILLPLNQSRPSFEVERQCAAIRALRDVEVEQLKTMLQLLHSYFTKEQLEMPVKQFFKENLPNVAITDTDKEGQYEVKWKEEDGNIYLNHGDERALHTCLLRRLSTAYTNYSAGFTSLGDFEFSNKSVKTVPLAAEKLQIRSLVLEEPSDSQVLLELRDGMQTPNVRDSRLSIGLTPRLPKCGEMLLSIRGSPLGVYKEDNMETIQETEDD